MESSPCNPKPILKQDGSLRSLKGNHGCIRSMWTVLSGYDVAWKLPGCGKFSTLMSILESSWSHLYIAIISGSLESSVNVFFHRKSSLALDTEQFSLCFRDRVYLCIPTCLSMQILLNIKSSVRAKIETSVSNTICATQSVFNRCLLEQWATKLNGKMRPSPHAFHGHFNTHRAVPRKEVSLPTSVRLAAMEQVPPGTDCVYWSLHPCKHVAVSVNNIYVQFCVSK